MWSAIRQLLSEQFGETETLHYTRLSSAETHEAWHLQYGSHQVFVKSDRHEMLRLFSAEADQLALLARSNTVKVPDVLGVGSYRDECFLLLEYIPAKPLDAHNAYRLGQQIARLHQWSDQPQFGLDVDNALTTTPQPNAWQRRWSTFFAEQRIGWQLELAAEKGLVYGNIDDIIAKVRHELTHHHPQPSLLHGDLWSNNCAQGPNGPYIYDPACYWGDRECDLAMLPLHPQHPPQIYDGYQSVFPLPDGFLKRQPVYQLYTLLNQATLFGGKHLSIAHDRVEQLMRQPD